MLAVVHFSGCGQREKCGLAQPMSGASKCLGMAPLPGFRPELLDFKRGIHVGNLEEDERITRILKLALESRYGQPFVTERWGRGVYWRWIGFLARANREAKPISSKVSFGCAKYFISLDPEESAFKCGMQVERGYLKAGRNNGGWQLQEDWDWNRMLAALRPRGKMEREIRRLLQEGFHIFAGSWGEGEPLEQAKPGLSAVRLRRCLEQAPARSWAGFQLFYPMGEEEVRSSAGPDLVDSMLAVFDEVTPVMNLCMQIELRRAKGGDG